MGVRLVGVCYRLSWTAYVSSFENDYNHMCSLVCMVDYHLIRHIFSLLFIVNYLTGEVELVSTILHIISFCSLDCIKNIDTDNLVGCYIQFCIKGSGYLDPCLKICYHGFPWKLSSKYLQTLQQIETRFTIKIRPVYSVKVNIAI